MHCLTENVLTTFHFGDWICSHLQVGGGDITLFGPLYKLNIHQKAQNQIQNDDSA